MFFNKKKKPKIDPKVRFQNRQFNQKLNEARTFKRVARPIPDGGFERFLRKIGLGSIWRQIFLGLLVLGAVYLVYAPNFLSVQSIKVEGLSEAELVRVQTAIQDDLNKVPFYNPQRNILFLSKSRVMKVLAGIPGIDSVENIDKQFKEKILLRNILIRDASNFNGLDKRYVRLAIKSRKDNIKVIDATMEVMKCQAF